MSIKNLARILAASTIFAVMVAVLLSCTKSPTNTAPTGAAVTVTDSKLVAAVETFNLPDLPSTARSKRQATQGNFGPDPGLMVPEDQLSNPEKLLVYGWLTQSNSGSTLTTTLRSVRRFYRAHNRFPDSGAELAAWGLEMSGMSPSQFIGMSNDQRLENCAAGMSPVTGKFFPSFTKDQWSAGGIYFRQLNSKKELEEAYARHPQVARHENANFKEAWLIKAYGEKPNEVILERPFLVYDMPTTADKDKLPPLVTSNT